MSSLTPPSTPPAGISVEEGLLRSFENASRFLNSLSPPRPQNQSAPTDETADDISPTLSQNHAQNVNDEPQIGPNSEPMTPLGKSPQSTTPKSSPSTPPKSSPFSRPPSPNIVQIVNLVPPPAPPPTPIATTAETMKSCLDMIEDAHNLDVQATILLNSCFSFEVTSDAANLAAATK